MVPKIDAFENVGAMLQLAPQGTVLVTSVPLAESLDQVADRNLLWFEHHCRGPEAVAATNGPIEMHLDSAGMRKLSKGDTIVLSMRGAVPNCFETTGVVTLFFKE